MNGLVKLIACSGVRDGHNRVQVSSGDPVNESASQLTVTPMLHDTFVRLDQTWSWQGEPQAGCLLVGSDPASGSADVYWVDTWHNGTKGMALSGAFDPQGKLVVRGRFAVGQGPNWGWRIEVDAGDGRLAVDMFCVSPEGRDEGGAWASFVRAAGQVDR